jgi:hypothetical protein
MNGTKNGTAISLFSVVFPEKKFNILPIRPRKLEVKTESTPSSTMVWLTTSTEAREIGGRKEVSGGYPKPEDLIKAPREQTSPSSKVRLHENSDFDYLRQEGVSILDGNLNAERYPKEDLGRVLLRQAQAQLRTISGVRDSGEARERAHEGRSAFKEPKSQSQWRENSDRRYDYKERRRKVGVTESQSQEQEIAAAYPRESPVGSLKTEGLTAGKVPLLTNLSRNPDTGQDDLGDGSYPPPETTAWIFKDEDGQEQRISFAEAAMTPALSVVDIIKNTFEDVLDAPISWWPLKQPRRTCPSTYTRLTWTCTQTVSSSSLDTPTLCPAQTCPKPFEFGIQNNQVDDFLSWIGILFSPGNASILPTYQPSGHYGADASENPSNPHCSNLTTLASSSSVVLKSSSGTTILRKSPLGSTRSQQTRDEYLPWCVDLTRAGTKLVEFDLKDLGDPKLVPTLLKAYRTVRGLPGWLSLTTCSGARLIKVRLHYTSQTSPLSNSSTVQENRARPKHHSLRRKIYSLSTHQRQLQLRLLRPRRRIHPLRRRAHRLPTSKRRILHISSRTQLPPKENPWQARERFWNRRLRPSCRFWMVSLERPCCVSCRVAAALGICCEVADGPSG